MPHPSPRLGTLIIGAGQAGVQLATALRGLGDTEPITLVGGEAHAPYQRPPLSKEFLAGTADASSLAFRTPAFYAEQGIELVRGEPVESLSLPTAARPGVARTGSGLALPFARLALATGAAPRRLDVPGADLEGILTLSDLDDAVRLRAHLAAARRVVVVGGGFVGLEAAAAARAQGRDVTVVEATDRLVGRAVSPVVSAYLAAAHRERGTTVLLSAGVVGFRASGGRVGAVLLADGTELPADLVVVGIGAAPRTELAEQIGLECDGGVVVDAGARTSSPHVVAAGDCTVAPHPTTGLGRVRLESVPGAVAQAGAAAASLLGRPAPARTVPWFWSHQGDLRLQIAGLSAGADRQEVRGDPASGRFAVLHYRHGTLLAVDAVNSPTDYLVVRKALATGRSLPADRAADPQVPLKSLLAG